MESEFLNDQRAYVNDLSALLSIMSNPRAGSVSISLKATIRAMPAWGKYPWRDLEIKSVKTTNLGALKFLCLIPIRILQSLAYLVAKYFHYLPYRKTKGISKNLTKLSFFSPGIHLEEFVNREVSGFWGDVKFLEPRLKSDANWFLIPYKPSGMSHKEVAKQIFNIQDKSSFSIFPIAALLNLVTLSKACSRVIKFHYHAGLCAFREIISLEKTELLWILDPNNLGTGIARVELNKCLIESTLSKFKPDKYVFHLMEGQSWEIALINQAKRVNKKTIGVIHTPLRKQDSQILNYLLHEDDEAFASKIEKILCPSEDSVKYLRNLGISSSRLLLVEAQRFSPHSTSSQHTYSSTSRKLLYVADASSTNSEFFQLQILKYLETVGTEDLDVHIQFHPSGIPAVSNLIKSWNSKDSGVWGLVVFGPETSAYLQPEFANSNIRIFNPKFVEFKVPTEKTPGVPLIEDLSQVLKSMLNPFVLGDRTNSLIYRNPNFLQWRKVIHEIFES